MIQRNSKLYKHKNFYHRSDIPMEIATSCEFSSEYSKECGEEYIEKYMAEGFLGSHAVVRDGGHYFGTCLFFNPPDFAPIGMDNKVWQ